MSKVPETYLYEVRNIGRVIKLDCGTEISTPRSLYLTKDDVKKCLQTAYIFRRFAEHGPERVTIVNLDRMHNPKFISEEEWKKTNVESNSESETVVEESPVIEEVVEIEPEVITEEINEVVSEPVDDENEEPEEVTEPTSVIENNYEQDTLVESETDSADIVDETEDELIEDSNIVTEEDDEVVDLGENNVAMGVVSESQNNQQTQTNTVKYNYKKHNKKKH